MGDPQESKPCAMSKRAGFCRFAGEAANAVSGSAQHDFVFGMAG